MFEVSYGDHKSYAWSKIFIILKYVQRGEFFLSGETAKLEVSETSDVPSSVFNELRDM